MLKLLLQQQPVARDLRQISAALKMIKDRYRRVESDIRYRGDYHFCWNVRSENFDNRDDGRSNEQDGS